jgi:hypothetical protein
MVAALTEKQRRVLWRLAHDWWLERTGHDGFSGKMGREGRHATAHVSRSDMTALMYAHAAIYWWPGGDVFLLTDEGRTLAK